jgi:hypothetical protein
MVIDFTCLVLTSRPSEYDLAKAVIIIAGLWSIIIGRHHVISCNRC